METKNNNIETESKDPILWKVAQKRAGFKYHLLIYCIINIFFWTIWYINHGDQISDAERGIFPWPLWPMFFWGIGVFFSYLGAYKSNNQLAEREYKKLTYKQ
ncbi:MAG: 2TM domain-containing protein [Ginsengibacter sp.]